MVVLAVAGHGFPIQIGFHPSPAGVILTVAVDAFCVWALIDVVRIPDDRWHAIGRSKGRWIVALVVLTILSPLGLIPAIWWFASVKRQISQGRRHR